MLRVVLGCIFVALPLIELALLIKTGQVIGFWATMGIVIGTGLLGAQVVLRQSWTTVRAMQEALARGRPPVAPVLDGAFLLLAGALLITPGLISDFVGLLLLIPLVRQGLARWLVRRLVRQAHVHLRVFDAAAEAGREPSPPSATEREGPIIEGEFERLGEKSSGPHRPDGPDRI
jgi:UPF0716 protein FxsA